MVFITGGTGFVGRHLVKRLTDEGKRVRCLVRSSGPALQAQSNVEIVKGDVLNPAGLAEAMSGCDTVVHLVGIWRANMATYRAVHIQGTANVVKAAQAAKINRFIYVSAMGVTLGIPTGFYLTKGESEGIVKESKMDYVIFRPAVIIGKGDEFTTALVDMIKKSPVVPVLGSGCVRLQPLWVGDLVDCLAKSIVRPGVVNKVYDIAGPDALSYDQILDAILQVLGVSKSKLHLPLGIISPLIRLAEIFIPNLPITYDQLKIMSKDNVGDVSAVVRDFDLKQTGFKEALKRYLP